MRSLALVALATFVTPAYAEVGGMVGARMTWLAGDTNDSAEPNVAVAGIAMLSVRPRIALGVEPGVTVGGSDRYRLIDVVLRFVGRYTYPLQGGSLRATIGLGPSLRVEAGHHFENDNSENNWDELENASRWDITVMAGIGYQRAAWFVDLRLATGVLTLDAREMPLAIVNRELGLWVGYTR